MSTTNQIKHLIIADDDEDDQMLLKEAIHEFAADIQCTPIHDGRQLMNFLKKGNVPELLLLDLNMPYKNGMECLIEIRAIEALKHLPIVILSTSRNTRDIELCFTHGANLFFTKPCSFIMLKELIHSLLKIKWPDFKRISSKQKFTEIANSGFVPIEEII